MSSILEQLYAGDLTPAENVIQGNEEYDRLCRQSVQEIEEFSKKLDDESRKSFDALLEHYLELTYIEKSQTFCDGFRLGAGIMCVHQMILEFTPWQSNTLRSGEPANII